MKLVLKAQLTQGWHKQWCAIIQGDWMCWVRKLDILRFLTVTIGLGIARKL